MVAGRGIAKLKEAGIIVDVGLLGAESHKIRTKPSISSLRQACPFVTVNPAMTLDGKLAAKTGDSRYVSGPESRELTHTLRHQHMAIMVGVQTALTDDPELRRGSSIPAVHPIRIIVDSQLRVPLDAGMLTEALLLL